jgi:hypothetical protein
VGNGHDADFAYIVSYMFIFLFQSDCEHTYPRACGITEVLGDERAY